MAPKRPSLSQRSELINDVHSHYVNVDTREIFLHSYVEIEQEEPGVDYRMAASFIKNLSILDYLEEKTIIIHMLTAGGSWSYGLAIYDAIKASKNHVIVLAHAFACSMSSLIPQAADTRIIMPNAEVLIHFGERRTDGTFTAVQAEAQWDKLAVEHMLDIYVERCQYGDFWRRNNLKTNNDIKEWLRKEMTVRQEYFMSARESVDFGLFDGVLGDDGYETIESLRNYKLGTL